MDYYLKRESLCMSKKPTSTVLQNLVFWGEKKKHRKKDQNVNWIQTNSKGKSILRLETLCDSAIPQVEVSDSLVWLKNQS